MSITLNETFCLSHLVEINANRLWDDAQHVNARFCRENHRAEGESMFIMDGTNYEQKIEDAEAFGCTTEFVEAYRTAVEQYKADLVMFHHDV